MGHGITSTDSMFSVREMPWHQLVEPLPEYPTREQAQAIAHPWEPIEVSVFRRVPQISEAGDLSVDYEEIPESKGIERSDNGAYLGTVNQTLGIVTNTEMWDVAEALQGSASDVKFETAGSLEGGRKVWILVRLDEPLLVKGDPNGATVPFFGLQDAKDGSGAFRGQALNTRIVCANTSWAADQETKVSGYEFVFKHTSKVGDRIEEAKSIVRLWRDQVHMWQQAMEHLVTVSVTPEQQRLFVEMFQPLPRGMVSDRTRANVDTARDQVRTILSSATCEGVDLTAYGLVQAGLEWNQHVRRTQGKTDRGRMENRFKRAMLTNDRLGHNLIELAQEVAHA